MTKIFALMGILFLCALFILSYICKLTLAVPLIYLIMSLVTYILYAKDKVTAKLHRGRTSEKLLHLFSLFGGWPGALLALYSLSHKSQKLSFQVILALTIVINIAMICYIFSLLTLQQWDAW